MATNLATKNKLHLMWSDSSFLPYLNPATVLDYFCDQRNPFYDSSCNNQILKMQGQGPEKLVTMEGIEYQLFLCQHPLYVVRKVHRSREFISPGVLKATPITFYYILHGNVYQAPDIMSIVSARLQMASFYLEECLETAFSHYIFNPSRGYYWDFNQTEETNKKEKFQQKTAGLQLDRIDSLLHEFANKFPPHKYTAEQMAQQNEIVKEEENSKQINNMDSQNVEPVEKKMKMNMP